jgi:hypothetical protein
MTSPGSHGLRLLAALGPFVGAACAGQIVTHGVRDAGASPSGTSSADASTEADPITEIDGGSSASEAGGAARDASASTSTDGAPASPPRDASATSDATTSPDAAPTADRFGVRMLYPTLADGREWYLPEDAERASGEWNVETNPVSKVASGVFHTLGSNGEVRLSVGSPAGRAWWRNVEMTGYYRYTAAHDSNGQERHWELLARCEKHSENDVAGNRINGGVAAPAATAVWPGYPFGSATINGHCLGSSYHGNLYVDGRALFEKEISHTEGYASQRAEVDAPGMDNPQNRWIGYKFVLRNADADRRVHLELWLDARADGNWQRVSQADDSKASWSAPGDLDGCSAAPFKYANDQLITWAGPWITFRSDSMEVDFRWLSAREIAPLP